MEVWSLILVSAVLVEAVTSAVKPIWDESRKGISYSVLVSMFIGIIIALAGDLDIPALLGLNISWPVLPQIFSGIIISRGSNFVYDLLNRFNGKTVSEEKIE